MWPPRFLQKGKQEVGFPQHPHLKQVSCNPWHSPVPSQHLAHLKLSCILLEWKLYEGRDLLDWWHISTSVVVSDIEFKRATEWMSKWSNVTPLITSVQNQICRWDLLSAQVRSEVTPIIVSCGKGVQEQLVLAHCCKRRLLLEKGSHLSLEDTIKLCCSKVWNTNINITGELIRNADLRVLLQT